VSAQRQILVTGGAGMIGSAVVRALLEQGHSVRVADQQPAPPWMAEHCELERGDLTDPQVAITAVRGATHVIHLAAIVGGIGNFHRYPHTLLQANNALTAALVRSALAAEVERFTYVSSSMVFERAFRFPTPESHLEECPPPRSAYGFSKLAGEVYCRAANEEHGLPYTICRPFNAYGPGELAAQEPGIAHAVPDLIAKVLSGQRPLQIFGAGTQTRTLTHVRDIAAGILAATFSPAGECQDFNISAERELTVEQIARIIWQACGEDPAQLAFEHLQSFTVDVQRRWPSVERARTLLGFEAQVPLEDGIAETVAWLRERQGAATA
jgi:UDP-glucose 4-epimerase